MRWTIRLRLTLLYGGLFFGTGVLLLGVTYVLAADSWPWAVPKPPALSGLVPELSTPLSDQLARQRAGYLHQLLTSCGIGLGLMTAASVGSGWLVTGRALRPLRTMASAVKSISASSLGRRLDATGRADEITDLAGTFDDLLDRLEGAFESERRFVANASHELRTPLTYERSVLEVALADPYADATELRIACERVLASNEQQGRLIEALLTLARSQRGLANRTELDLASVVASQLPEANGIRIDAELEPAPMQGDQALLERLTANLVDNAVRHNVSGGTMTVSTGVENGRAGLRVCNTGPVVPAAQVDRLFQPFQRLAGGRTAGNDGHGVGLAIVAAVAEAHGAELHAEPGPDGGLDIRVAFAPTGGAPIPGGSPRRGSLTTPMTTVRTS